MNAYRIAQSIAHSTKLKAMLPGGVHYNFRTTEKDYVLHFARGAGSRLWDIDNNEYLDLYAKSGAMILGHGNPAYTHALMGFLETMTSVDLGTIEYDVCGLISKYIPCAEMIRFGLSGTEIIQNALRLSRAYTKRNRFIRFDGHYHGNADNIMGGITYTPDYPVPDDKEYRLTTSTEGRARNVLEEQSFFLPWNDSDTLEKVVHKYGDDIAAIIMEPICINGGGIFPQPGYLERVRELCSKHGIVLIFDEVITGFRVGLRGAQTLLGVTPDLAVFAKCISGGIVPVSVLVGKRDLMQMYETKKVVHGGTFNGYQFGLAAIKATLEILGQDSGRCYEHMDSCAKKIHAVMLEEAGKIGLPMVIQGHPSSASFHYREWPIDKSSDIDSVLYANNTIIRNRLACYGILMAPLSRIYPNISLTDEDVAFFRQRVGEALKEAHMIIQRRPSQMPRHLS